jgi:hypothetical protein
MEIDIWPDNQAVSPSRTPGRVQAPPNIDQAVSVAPSPAAQSKTRQKAHLHERHREILQCQRLRLHSAGRWGKDVVHATALERRAASSNEGQKVVFDTQEDRRNRKIAVANIQAA